MVIEIESQLPVLSATKIKMFKTCARKYQLRYLQGMKERDNIAAFFGKALHMAFEDKYKEGKSPIHTFQMTFSNLLDDAENDGKVILGVEYFSRMLKTGKDILRQFDFAQWKPRNYMYVEYPFMLPFEDNGTPIVSIQGVIDLVTEDDCIIDHKSSKKAPTQAELDNDVQFLIYTWWYKETFGKLPRRVIWNHLRKNEQYDFSLYNIDERLEQLKEDIRAMLNNMYYQRKNIDKSCFTECSFAHICFPTIDASDVLEELED